MKKILLTALIAVSLVSVSFAKEPSKVNYSVRTSFRQDFKEVEDVKWTTGKAYTTASFVLNGKRTEAYYENNGALIGTSQGITLEQLPAKAKRAFAKKYGSYTVKEAIRFDKSDETAYFISADNGTGSVIVKVINNDVSRYK